MGKYSNILLVTDFDPTLTVKTAKYLMPISQPMFDHSVGDIASIINEL